MLRVPARSAVRRLTGVAESAQRGLHPLYGAQGKETYGTGSVKRNEEHNKPHHHNAYYTQRINLNPHTRPSQQPAHTSTSLRRPHPISNLSTNLSTSSC